MRDRGGSDGAAPVFPMARYRASINFEFEQTAMECEDALPCRHRTAVIAPIASLHQAQSFTVGGWQSQAGLLEDDRWQVGHIDDVVAGERRRLVIEASTAK